jgi:DNA-binding response OmpR family regulator
VQRRRHVAQHRRQPLAGRLLALELATDDEPSLQKMLAHALEREGFQVQTVGDGEEALEAFKSYEPHLIILDIMLPKLDGTEVCRRIRAQSDVPIIMLTAKDDEIDRVVGLELGADDYVTKPFRLAELLARVRALLRRGTTEPAVAPVVHGIRIDVESHRAWMGETELHLTAKEFDLLRVLVRDAGRVVTREQLMREVWDITWWTSTKTLDMHISWLRKKLGDDAANPRYIATVRGVGFRFEKN